MECQNQTLFVEPNLTFAERIKRGNYGWRNKDLTKKRFSVTGDQHGPWEWRYFYFTQVFYSEEAIQRIREEDFEPAQSGHALTFGEKYPEEQRKHPIISLGSVSDAQVIVLWSGHNGREIDLTWFSLGGTWHNIYRCLGVRRPAGYTPA
jgi:hypothetical protein